MTAAVTLMRDDGEREPRQQQGDWENRGFRGGRDRAPCLDRVSGARSKEDTQHRRNEGGSHYQLGRQVPSQTGLTSPLAQYLPGVEWGVCL